MSDHSDYQATAQVLDSGYFAGSESGPSVRSTSGKEEKPTHYKVICISMYTKDLKQLDAMVDTLKARGMTKANRSALIRYALGEVDLDNVPQGL
jgi:hypothetical protein